MDNLAFTKVNDVWTASTSCPASDDGLYYWPLLYPKLRFLSYAPTDAAGLKISSAQGSAPWTIGRPKFSYTVPADVSSQSDLVCADTGDLQWGVNGQGSDITLSFKHVLTGVVFVVGKDFPSSTISKIKISGVYGGGVCSMGGGWTVSGSNDCSYEIIPNTSLDIDGTDEGTLREGTPMASSQMTFIMMPQTLTDNAKFEISYLDTKSGENKVITAKLKTDNMSVWEMGRVVKYRLSKSSYISTFEIPSDIEFDYKGATKALTIKSFSTNSKNQKRPEAWTSEFVDSQGQPLSSAPQWVSSSLAFGNGNIVSETDNITVNPQSMVSDDSHNETLRSKNSINVTSGKTVYNLSNSTGASAIQNTANCYIINAPGTYSLPLVYGNGVKNSTSNTHAYTSRASGTGVLQTFVNHLDNPITSPNIWENTNCTPASATIIWQDEQGLVETSSISLTADGHAIQFNIPQGDSFKQGNAIIAVKDASNQVMWSWHIWVTDYEPNAQINQNTPLSDKVVQNIDPSGTDYTFMPIPLGWCNPSSSTWSKNMAYMKFTQTNTGKTALVRITQFGHGDYGWNAVYYQWGRKDPMLPGGRKKGENKSCYPQGAFTTSGMQVTIGGAIKNPGVFYNDDKTLSGNGGQDWCSSHYYNLWSEDENTEETRDHVVYKTIYDPSPVGYHVPAWNAFSVFAYQGENLHGSYYGTRFNSPYTSPKDFAAKEGFEYYCNRMPAEGSYDPSGGTIFFPALNCRSFGDGTFDGAGAFGNLWAADPSVKSKPDHSKDYSHVFFYSNAYTNVKENFNRIHGYPVVPVRTLSTEE